MKKLLMLIDQFVTGDWFGWHIMKSRVWQMMPWRVRVWRWFLWEGCYMRQMKREGKL